MYAFLFLYNFISLLRYTYQGGIDRQIGDKIIILPLKYSRYTNKNWYVELDIKDKVCLSMYTYSVSLLFVFYGNFFFKVKNNRLGWRGFLFLFEVKLG